MWVPGREVMTEGETLSNGQLWSEIAGLHPGEAYPALLVDIERSHQQNAHRSKQCSQRDPVPPWRSRSARRNHVHLWNFSGQPEDRARCNHEKQEVCPQQSVSCMSKGEPSQVREPSAKQDADQYGCCPAVRSRYKPVKPAAEQVAKIKCQRQINQS